MTEPHLQPGAVLIDAAVVARVAHLARVRLEPEEAVRLEHDLARIVAYVTELWAIDTTGVQPMLHPGGQAMSLRPDLVAPSLGAEVAMRNGAAVQAGSFVVPRVVG